MEKIMVLQRNPTSLSTQLFPTTTAYNCSLSCSNVISFRFPRRINIVKIYSFQKFTKRTNVVNLTKASLWEDPDDGSDSEDDDEEEVEEENEMEEEEEEEEEDMDVKSKWDYGAENKATASSTNGLSSSNSEEEFMKEVEQLLSPEERAILYCNHTTELDKISTEKWNPLHTFALAGQIRFMDRLLEEGLDIDVVDKEGRTALHHAVFGKKEAVISHLLRKDANPQVRDLDGVTPLHYAVQVGAMQTVKLLIKYKVDVNVADNAGWTPLHVAMQSRNRDIAKILLVNGADKYRKNKDGNTPLDLSLCYGKDFKSYDLAKLLKLVPANREL
ncbi:ankyrin repeat domain-containing protein EMB506, chloroplastic isoform X1 [Nicotiana tomentosiformis]|uniref:ankyrin repeat domain-containing protein EMB506, chloroplastic isoform X1 n=1 Tax=Nicotiana tomentosiformis TaxID=4098 RepID=UPI00051B3631|nr:ankyrin repeat domain-containing protein EMB506, chloroplastic isoform X1 [Nicotiana tomentosiformis]